MDSIPITKVILPLKSGYVEIETQDGVRTYKNVSTGELLENEQGLDRLKYARIQQSKQDLAAYLESHPIQWDDGKFYSITAEKQQWLTSKLFSASAAKAAGEEYPLTWNDTEEVCTAWTYENLWALARKIDARVTALVTYQQTQEVAMRNAANQEELDAITVDYDTVPVPALPEANS